MGKFEKKKKEKKKNPPQVELMLYVRELMYLLIPLILLFTFAFRVVVVSGPSMYSTLYDGDVMLLLTHWFCGEPKRGDIVVLSQQDYHDGSPLVKRVIATEGEMVDIDFEAGVVYVNGKALDEPYTYDKTLLEEGMQFPVIVSEGCVFVLGDNRNDSTDSRSPDIGMVDKREILGRALLLMLPGSHQGTENVDFDRVGVIQPVTYFGEE